MTKWYMGALLALALYGVGLAEEDIVINQNRLTKAISGKHLVVSLNSDGCHIKVDGQVTTLNVRGKRSDITVNGETGSVVVPGSNNKITLTNGLDSLLVGGNENVIVVTGIAAGDKAPRLEMAGNGNVVQWSKANKAPNPDWVDNGRHNTLKDTP